jgi:signal transduction histidine kinase
MPFFARKVVDMNATKLLPHEENRRQVLKDWVKDREYDLLMTSRQPVLDYAVIAGIFIILSQITLLPIACTWLALVIMIDLFIRYQLRLYNSLVKSKSSDKSRFESTKKFRLAWYLNMVSFGLITFIFSGNHSYLVLITMTCLLHIFMVLCVAKTSAHLRFCHSLLYTFLACEYAGFFWHIATTFSFSPPAEHYIFMVYIAVLGWMLTQISSGHFKQMQDNLQLQITNMDLIGSLQNKSKLLDAQRIAALQANDTIQRFYSNAAHDVRQPVYAMQMYASMLKDDPSLSHILLPKIEQSCVGINDLFNSLFDFQQLKLGVFDYKPANINILALFESMQTVYTPLAQKKNLDIRFKALDGTLFTDEILIKRVLGNLITNAIRYTKTGGLLVAVRHCKSKKMLSFEVWDTGVGISKENQELIFNEFFKITNVVQDADEGFGLGLSIIKQLTRNVAGSQITVRSAINHGSVFKFGLPEALYSKVSQLAHYSTVEVETSK